MTTRVSIALLIALGMSGSFALSAEPAPDRGEPWVRHTIDDSSRGADGVRLADVNGDGLQDITTGWEEGGRIRVYINPGPAKAKEKWPAVTVGEVKSPEDAVFVDLDNDGAIDVVSSCEGKTRSMFVHWAPNEKEKYLDPASWKTEPIPAAKNAMMWMYCLPLDVDGKNGIDLVAGAKGQGAKIGWFESPENPRNLADWKWHPLRDAGWIMSLIAVDADGDKDLDILASDRKGAMRGCFWLENPGRDADLTRPWKEHAIGGADKEVMFMHVADTGPEGIRAVLAAVRGLEILWFARKPDKPLEWDTKTIPLPPNTGTAKAVLPVKVNDDSACDVVFTCENARRKSGVVWLSPGISHDNVIGWTGHEISGPVGTKYDLVEPLDLDDDGDLDLITCEEAENLGVIWYENPSRPAAATNAK